MADQELQQKIGQLQAMSQQLQMAAQQRMQFEGLLAETNQAIEALEELDADATVYRSVGTLLVKDSGRDAALARLKDDVETMELRVKRAKSQEEQLREAAEALQKELQSKLQ